MSIAQLLERIEKIRACTDMTASGNLAYTLWYEWIDELARAEIPLNPDARCMWAATVVGQAVVLRDSFHVVANLDRTRTTLAPVPNDPDFEVKP